ncbi:hypothetical protein GEZ74_02375 [Streptococcus mitis]|nr:hypothetical protein [Streptococcus mitis]
MKHLFCHFNPLWIDEIIRLAYKNQDTKPSSSSKENRKSNDRATAPRQIYLFPKSCRRVQFSRY